MDKLEELEVLIAILDEGTLAAAARKTGRSAAAVTHLLGDMEKRIGVRLVERTTRKLAATDAGRRLADNGRRLLADYRESLDEAMGAALSPTGTLRVSAPLIFGRRHIAPVVARYLALYPQTQVELLLTNETVDLIDSNIDVALRIGQLNDSRLTARTVGEVRRVVVASPAYLKQHGKPTTPAALSRHALIMMSIRGEVQTWHFKDAANLITLTNSRFIVNQAETAIDAAIAGAGLARPLSYQVADELKSGALVRILKNHEPPAIPVSLIYTSRKHMPMRTRAFIDLAASSLEGLECIRKGRGNG